MLWAEPQHQAAQSGWSLEHVGGATALGSTASLEAVGAIYVSYTHSTVSQLGGGGGACNQLDQDLPWPSSLLLQAHWTLTVSCCCPEATCSAMTTAKRAAEQWTASMTSSSE